MEKKKETKRVQKREKKISTGLSGQDVKAAPTPNIMFVPLLHRGQ